MPTGDRQDWDIDERFAGLDAMATEARLIADGTMGSDTGDASVDHQRDTLSCRDSLVAIATEALKLADDLATGKIVIADRPSVR